MQSSAQSAIMWFLLCLVLSFAVVCGHEVEGEAGNGYVTKHQPQINPQQCPSLYPPVSPYVEMPIPGLCTLGVAVGTRCSIGCVAGFELVGPCSRVCQESGSWSGTEPQCIDRRVRCPSLRLGLSILKGQGLPSVPGQLPSRRPGPLANVVDSMQNTNASDNTSLPVTTTVYNIIVDKHKHALNSSSSNHTLIGLTEVNESSTIPTDVILKSKSNASSAPQFQPPGQFPDDVVPAAPVDPLSCLEFAGAVCRFVCPEQTFPVSSLNIVCQQSGLWSQSQPMCQRQSATPPTDPTPYPTPYPTSYPTPYPTSDPSGTPPYPPPSSSPCNDLNPPTSGSVSGICVSAAAGQACFFSCFNGFSLVGAERTTCTENGWDAKPPLCLPVTRPPSPCTALQPPQNGYIQGSCSEPQVGQTCAFSCLLPLYLMGTAILTCTPIGWSSRPPTCGQPPASGCPALYPVQYGSMQGNCNEAQVGQSCYFTCQPGYNLNGYRTLFCTANGWNSRPPVCTPENPPQSACPTLQPPPLVQVQGSCVNARPGEQCFFSCTTGFTLYGPGSLSCTSSGWTPSRVPICCPSSGTYTEQPPSQMTCPSISAPQNGQALGTCNNAFVDQICYFTCNPGFSLVGPRSLSCRGPLGWSSSPPICLPDGQPAPPPPISQCPPISPLPGAPTPLPSACFDLNPPNFGFVRGSCVSANVGESCYFSCSAGYGLIGVRQLTCGSTGWSAQSPVCLPIICPNITGHAHGVLSGSCAPGVSSKACTLVCDPGYKLAGSAPETNSATISIVCTETREWSAMFPACIPITCPALPDTIPNGNSVQGSFCSPGEALKICQYRCNPGFYVSGSSSIICQLNGLWSSSVPVCNRITCRSIFASDKRVVTGQCDPGYAGTSCEVACAPRFAPMIPTILRCLANASWEIDPPDCQRIQCAPVPPISNAQKLDSNDPTLLSNCNPPLAGSQCVIRCNPNYWTESEHMPIYAIQCTDEGQLTGNLQNCIPITCPLLSSPPNGALSGNCYDALVGQKCTYSCSPNFFGAGEGECGADGKWTAPFDGPVTCQRKVCTDWNITAVISNGYMEGLGCANTTRPGIAGEYCIYRCEVGYALRGNPYIRCLDDKINDPFARFDPAHTPECIQILCPRPIPAAMSGVLFIDCTLYRAGTSCNTTCENSEFKPSVPLVTCLASGNWDLDPSTVTCASGKPTCSDALPANPDGQWVGDCSPGIEGMECRFECRYGFIVGNKGVRKCVAGSWDSTDIPQCIPVTCAGLTAPSNAILEGTCSPGVPSMTCLVACSPGYTLDPPNAHKVLMCNADGMWSAEMPACVGISCPSLTPPPGGFMSGSCTPGRARDSCLFQCPSGYYIRGMPNIVCQADGKWSGPVPRCVSPSGQLPPGGTGPSPGPPGSGPGTPFYPGPSSIPYPTNRPQIPSTPGCRPRRACCQVLVLQAPFVIGGCRNGNWNRLPEAGTSCQVRCRSGELVEMKAKAPKRVSSSLTSSLDKQELFIPKKVITVTCMRSQRWSGADLSAMRCVPRLANHGNKNSRPVAGRPWINIKTNESRLIVTDR